jgi:hypothetical protein
MKVMVCLVNGDAWPFPRFVGRPGEGWLVLEIGNLLGGDDSRDHQEDENSESNSLTHVTSIALQRKVLPPNEERFIRRASRQEG